MSPRNPASYPGSQPSLLTPTTLPGLSLYRGDRRDGSRAAVERCSACSRAPSGLPRGILARLEPYDAAGVAVRGLAAAVGVSSRQGVEQTLVLSHCLAPGHWQLWKEPKKGQNVPFLLPGAGSGLGPLLPEDRKGPWQSGPFPSETPQRAERVTPFPRDAGDVPEKRSGKASEPGSKGESFVRHIWIRTKTSARSPPAAKQRACTEGTASSPARGTASDPARN